MPWKTGCLKHMHQKDVYWKKNKVFYSVVIDSVETE